MQILLTFDVEVWCNGWNHLDEAFPAAFDRYIFGRSRHGQYALPKTLEILSKHGLKGVFFVEPLFAARFGIEHLARIVDIILQAGQDIELHLHPEWSDEIDPPPLAKSDTKRQHLRYYTLEEQQQLIALGGKLLQQAGGGRPRAFRAGNFAANEDTFRALLANGLQFDSSLNSSMAGSGPDLRGRIDLDRVQQIHGIYSCPMSVFRDGLGKMRHAQVGACSANEIICAADNARTLGWSQFVILSHNFELLKPGSSEPDRLVVRRFDKLCSAIAERDTWTTAGFNDLNWIESPTPPAVPRGQLTDTLLRYTEQLIRRI